MSECVAIFGGTFSPPHVGHVSAATHFYHAVEPDRLLIIPTYLPPHKETDAVASPSDRMEMCRLAFSDIGNVEISDIEIARGGKSYTAETLEALTKEGRKLLFLCGADMMITLGNWYAAEKIFALCDLYTIGRYHDPAFKAKMDHANLEYLRRFGKQVHILDVPEIEVSSTEIRVALSQGKSHLMLPEKVFAYIKERGLYQ